MVSLWRTRLSYSGVPDTVNLNEPERIFFSVTNYQGQTASQIVSKLKTNSNMFLATRLKEMFDFVILQEFILFVLKCQSDRYAY